MEDRQFFEKKTAKHFIFGLTLGIKWMDDRQNFCFVMRPNTTQYEADIDYSDWF